MSSGGANYALKTVDVVFDSSLRNYGTNDNPSFYVRNIDNVVGMSVAWVSIPFCFYMVDNTNNTFQLRGGTVAGINSAGWSTISLRPGTYSAVTFAQEFRRACVDTSVGALENNADFYCYVDGATARLTIYNTGLATSGTVETFQLRMNGNTSLAKMLGFDASTTYQAQLVTQWWNEGATLNTGNPLHVLVAPQQVYFVPPVINLFSKRLSGLMHSQREPENEDERILVVPLLGNFTTQIQFQPSTGMIPIPSRVTISDTDFKLTIPDRDRYSLNAVDPNPSVLPPTQNHLCLNNVPFQVCIRFFQDLGYGAN